MPDPLFDNLFRATAQLTWSSPADVERRGRQRRRRQVLLATAASVVLVLGVTSGVLAATGQRAEPPLPPATTPTTASTPPGPTPTSTSASPKSAPTIPEIPVAALLQESDVGSGFRVIQPEHHGDGSLNSVSIYCRNPAPGFHQPLAAGERIFTKGQDSVSETIQRYAGAHAKGYLDHVRSWVGACVPIRNGDRVSVVGEGFVGEGSLLIESTIEGILGMWVLVRQGDLVAEITPARHDPVEARRLADRAAVRLCAGTDAC